MKTLETCYRIRSLKGRLLLGLRLTATERARLALAQRALSVKPSDVLLGMDPTPAQYKGEDGALVEGVVTALGVDRAFVERHCPQPGRLIDLGVQPFMVGSAISAVLGQRLVRRLCKKCRVRFKPSAETLKKLGASSDMVRFLYRPPDPKDRNGEEEDEEAACEECGGAGYCRRTGVFELLVVSDSIRDLIRASPDLGAIRAEAVKGGLHTLFEDGTRLVTEGETSLQELLRVAK